MTEFIYRVDDKSALEAISDGYLRARKWPRDEYDYPHALLGEAQAALPSTKQLHRICFWSSLTKAIVTKTEYQSHRADPLVLRCDKSSIIIAGYTESWDDAVGDGVAYLFWKVELKTKDNQRFSAAGIRFSCFDALVDGQWLALDRYLGRKKEEGQRTIVDL